MATRIDGLFVELTAKIDVVVETRPFARNAAPSPPLCEGRRGRGKNRDTGKQDGLFHIEPLEAMATAAMLSNWRASGAVEVSNEFA